MSYTAMDSLHDYVIFRNTMYII